MPFERGGVVYDTQQKLPRKDKTLRSQKIGLRLTQSDLEHIDEICVTLGRSRADVLLKAFRAYFKEVAPEIQRIKMIDSRAFTRVAEFTDRSAPQTSGGNGTPVAGPSGTPLQG